MRDTGCLMRGRDDGQCSHHNMQISSEAASDALLYGGGYEWRPLLQNYYDNWGVFGGWVKLKVNTQTLSPPKTFFFFTIDGLSSRQKWKLSLPLKEDIEIHNNGSWRQRCRDVTTECDDHVSGSWLRWLPVSITTESNSSSKQMQHVV